MQAVGLVDDHTDGLFRADQAISRLPSMVSGLTPLQVESGLILLSALIKVNVLDHSAEHAMKGVYRCFNG
jgi:hypothetical protein